MATQYTTTLKLALPTQGELTGTWGDVVNDNITSMVEEAIAGRAVIDSWTTNSHTLTTANGTTSESRCAMLEFTDTGTALTGAGEVICPANPKIYLCKNDSGQAITVKTSAGTGIAVQDGEAKFVFCDGTNVVEAVTSMTTLKIGTGTQVDGIIDDDTMATAAATNIPTAESVKAYVDAQVGANNELSEVLANGNTTGGTSISVNSTDNILFGDNNKAIFGAGSDLQIFHDGSNSYVKDTGTGDLMLQGVNVRIQGATTGNNMFVGVDNGASTLYYQNAAKLATTSTGIDVTGNTLSSDTFEIDSSGNGFLVGGGQTGTTAIGKLHNSAGVLTLDADSTRSIKLATGTNQRLRIDGATGDISFYEDTGTTPKFFWDASAESLGINVTDPIYSLEVQGEAGIELYNATGGGSVLNFRPSLGDANKYNLSISSYDHSGGGVGPADGLSINGFDGVSVTTGSSTTRQERLRITSSGNVGIGTSSPAQRLDVRTAAANAVQARFGFVSGRGLEISTVSVAGTNDAGSVFNALGSSAGTMIFQTDSSERLRVDSSGNVGIGTSSPAGILQLKAANPDFYITSDNTGQSDIYFGGTTTPTKGRIQFSDNSDFMAFWTNSTQRMTINSSGNVGIGTSSPANLLDVNADSVRVRTAQTPASASATGNQGEIAWDANYIYVCVATNTWKRAAIATW